MNPTIPKKPLKLTINKPPISPLIVVPKYIAALDSDDTVLLAVIVVLCNVVINIGKTKPLNKNTKVKTITAISMFTENGTTI